MSALRRLSSSSRRSRTSLLEKDIDHIVERKTIVIIGAGWAGLPLAHKLLKQSSAKNPFRVVLVSPNSHFFWNVAATRGVIPGEVADEDLFLPIEPAFAQYPPERFEFVLGLAKAIDVNRQVVLVKLCHRGGQRAIPYEHVVVATGSRLISGMPFKSNGTYENTLQQWWDLQSQVAKARSIVIAGGGPTGVEVAGELAAKYGPEKQITIVTNGKTLLCDAQPSVRAAADRNLRSLGVKIIYENRAMVATTPHSTGSDGGSSVNELTTITLSKGGYITGDLFLPLYGVVVNSSFLPARYLDWEGNLRLDETMRVVGTDNVWGIGDVGNLEPKLLMVLDSQVLHLSAALAAAVSGAEPPPPYKPHGDSAPRLFALGKRHGTGSMGRRRMFGFLVAMIKGRKLFMDHSSGFVEGRQLVHGKM